MNINSPLHYFAILSVNIKANLCLKASNVLTISEGGVLVVIVAPQWHKMQKKKIRQNVIAVLEVDPLNIKMNVLLLHFDIVFR